MSTVFSALFDIPLEVSIVDLVTPDEYRIWMKRNPSPPPTPPERDTVAFDIHIYPQCEDIFTVVIRQRDLPPTIEVKDIITSGLYRKMGYWEDRWRQEQHYHWRLYREDHWLRWRYRLRMDCRWLRWCREDHWLRMGWWLQEDWWRWDRLAWHYHRLQDWWHYSYC